MNLTDFLRYQAESVKRAYLIATVEELDSQLWTVNSIKPNTDNTVSLTVAEYSDAIYQ